MRGHERHSVAFSVYFLIVMSFFVGVRCQIISPIVPRIPLAFGSFSVAQSRRRVQTLRMSTATTPVIPRAAVSVVVKCSVDKNSNAMYALVQRGNEPNKGMWSLPGGKIETGEYTLTAAQRELWEETRLGDADGHHSLEWFDGAFMCSDSIHRNDAGIITHHYVISQCFCRVVVTTNNLPTLMACDDAMDAKWWTLSEIQNAVDQGKASPGIVQVFERAETLHSQSMLPCK
jgi:ADP-ribose pyrophosphatase YjhB (NUDIX family)|mmetsp:Transcript_978/g.1821  ORF Transcript_978/g.1821 Transcript_978/m.1821 type:complete len:231 (-) Transcript_978:1501-2193(-)